MKKIRYVLLFLVVTISLAGCTAYDTWARENDYEKGWTGGRTNGYVTGAIIAIIFIIILVGYASQKNVN